MSLNLKRILVVFGLVVTALLITRPAFLMEWAQIGDDRREHLGLAAYEGDVGALEWIAHERGFFGKVGLDVDIKGYASGKDAIAALRGGQAEVATAADFVVASGSFTDPGLRVLANISYYRNKSVVARRDRGIERPEDLKGKRIGVTSPSGAEYTLYVFLAMHGLDEKDVTLVHLSPKEIVDAMARGSIDAAITWEPHVQEIQSLLGTGAATFEGSVFDVYLLLVTRQETVTAKEKAMKKLMHAMVLAEEWARANPDEARTLIANRFHLNPAALDLQWRRMQLAVTLPQELLVTMDGQARWLAGRSDKGVAAIPNYSGFIAPALLRSVKPSAVTLYSDTAPGSGLRLPSPVAAR